MRPPRTALVGLPMRFFYLDDQETNSLVAPVSTTSIETLFAGNVKKFSWQEGLMFARCDTNWKNF
jgi:hypothetical protein